MWLVPLWPVWVVPALVLMRLLAGRNVGAVSPDSAPELAHLGKYMLFSFPRDQQPPLSAVDQWCVIAPSWLVIEHSNLLRILRNITPYVLVSASCTAESVRMGPEELYLRAKWDGWRFSKPIVHISLTSSCSCSYTPP